MTIVNDILSQANADFSGVGPLTSFENPPVTVAAVATNPAMPIIIGLVVLGLYFMLKGKKR